LYFFGVVKWEKIFGLAGIYFFPPFNCFFFMSKEQKSRNEKESSKNSQQQLKLQTKGVTKKKKETWADRIPGYDKMVRLFKI
jgi:hypothetical protein